MGARHENRVHWTNRADIAAAFAETNTPDAQHYRLVNDRIFELEQKLEIAQEKLRKADKVISLQGAMISDALTVSSNTLGETLDKLSRASGHYPRQFKADWKAFISGAKVPNARDLNALADFFGADVRCLQADKQRDIGAKKVQEKLNGLP